MSAQASCSVSRRLDGWQVLVPALTPWYKSPTLEGRRPVALAGLPLHRRRANRTLAERVVCVQARRLSDPARCRRPQISPLSLPWRGRMCVKSPCSCWTAPWVFMMTLCSGFDVESGLKQTECVCQLAFFRLFRLCWSSDIDFYCYSLIFCEGNNYKNN